MKDVKIEINLKYCQLEELSDKDTELVKAAIDATNNAYAKYSHFHVGAAVRLENGDIVIGANQENAALPSGVCAERSAIFAAQSQYPQQPITTLAIAANNEKGLVGTPISPCGSCRQVLLEVEQRYNKPIKIILYGSDYICCVNSVKDILPLFFEEKSMH